MSTRINLYRFFNNNKLYPIIVGLFFALKIYESIVVIAIMGFKYFLQNGWLIWLGCVMVLVFWALYAWWWRELNDMFYPTSRNNNIPKFAKLFSKETGGRKEGFEEFSAKIIETFNHPLVLLVLIAFFVLISLVGLLNIPNQTTFSIGIPASYNINWNYSIWTAIKAFLVPFIFGSIPITPLGAIALYHLILIRYTRSLSKNVKLREKLALFKQEQLDEINFDNLMEIEDASRSSIEFFKEESAFIAHYSLKITLVAFAILMVLNIYLFVMYKASMIKLVPLYVVADLACVLALFYTFIYPQIAIHDVLEEKRELIRRIMATGSQILLNEFLESQKTNALAKDPDRRLIVLELDALKNQIHYYNNFFSWTFNYKQILTLVGSALASSITLFISVAEFVITLVNK